MLYFGGKVDVQIKIINYRCRNTCTARETNMLSPCAMLCYAI